VNDNVLFLADVEEDCWENLFDEELYRCPRRKGQYSERS
jgi:hypothetical protein